MRTFQMRAALFAAIAALTLTAAPAAAQQAVPESGGRVYALVGGGFGDGTFIGTGVGAGLRLTRHLGLDVELTHLSTRDDYATRMSWFDVPVVSAVSALAVAEDFPPAGADDYLFPSISFEEQGRDVTTFLTKFTVEFPIADGRLFPYLTGGGGVGRVTERFGVFVDPIPWFPLEHLQVADHPDGSGDAGHSRHVEALSLADEYSELGLSLVLGGGVDVRLWRGLGVGVDIRWLRVLRSYDAIDTAQVTARASYRF